MRESGRHREAGGGEESRREKMRKRKGENDLWGYADHCYHHLLCHHAGSKQFLKSRRDKCIGGKVRKRKD